MKARLVKNYGVCLALAALLLLALGCESPVSDDRPANINDPKSEIYEVGEIHSLNITPEPDGTVIIRWHESSAKIDEYLIEKSLGDDSSYVEIGRVPQSEFQFSDKSGEVRGETHYRVSSLYSYESEELIIDQNSARLDFGNLNKIEYVFLEEENKLTISWETSHSLFTHYEIHSSSNISGVPGTPVRIESGSVSASFIDQLADVSFSSRNYIIMAFIESDGYRDKIMETDFRFDPAKYYFLENFSITIHNERDWELEWEDNVFFAESYRISKTVGGDLIEIIVPGESSSFLDTTIVETDYTTPIDNQNRHYSIRSIDKNGNASQLLNRKASLYVNVPIITLIGGNNIENSINIEWMEVDEAAQSIIIERAEQEYFRPLEFKIIAQVETCQDSYTDFNVDSDKTYHYRVRTLTSSVYNNVAVAYQEVYNVSSSFTWDISFPAKIESTSDGRFIAWLEETGSVHTIKVFDLLSNQYHSEIVTDTPVRITDIKITPDEEFIYFAAPEERAIYRAEFPSGNSITRVIEDTDQSQDHFGFGIANIDISPDGNLIAGTGGIGHFAMFDREDYNKIYTYSEYGSHSAVININLAFSPVDDLIAINSTNNLTLHNIADGSLEMSFQNYPSSDQIGFSKEGTYVHTRDAGYVRIFNINNGSEFRVRGGYIGSDPATDDRFLLGRQSIDIEQGRFNGTVGEFMDNSRVLGQTESIIKFDFRHVNIWSKTGEERWNYLYEYQYNFGGFNEPHYH